MKRIKIKKPVSSVFNRKSLLTGILLLLVNICCLQLFAQNKTITGVVVDEMGEPVTGANISVAGTSIGAMTDIDGKFSLNAPASGTLVISYIGYKKKEVPLGQEVYNLTLQEDVEALEEVVVIGYGVQRKEALPICDGFGCFDERRKNARYSVYKYLAGITGACCRCGNDADIFETGR